MNGLKGTVREGTGILSPEYTLLLSYGPSPPIHQQASTTGEALNPWYGPE